jgi:hypothetical protein
VHDAKNKDLVVPHEVHDPVSPENNFSNVLAVKLGKDTSDVGSFKKQLCGFNDVIDERDCMNDRIARAEVFDLLEIRAGGQRPADLRHRAILSFSA